MKHRLIPPSLRPWTGGHDFQKRSLKFPLFLGCALTIIVAFLAWRGAPLGAPPSVRAANGLPDLTVVEIASAQAVGGCPLNPAGLLITIRNQGSVAAGSFTTTFSGGSTSCGPWELDALPAGEERIFFCEAGMPGASVYTAIVDSGDTVLESDETNNQLTTVVWVITLPTCTPSATPTATPTASPTGWLGPLTIAGHVREAGSMAPVANALVGGYVFSLRAGGGGVLPAVTPQPDGYYQIRTGFGVYDTDTVQVNASAPGYQDGMVQRLALQVYQGPPVDLLLSPIVPTPTATPTSATFLHVTLSLQGRPPAPHPSWQVPLSVTLSAGETVVRAQRLTCDSSGSFRLTELAPGIYTLKVKGLNTLSNVKQGLALEEGPNLVHMGVLRSGDTNGDDWINILDFSLFRTLYGGDDPRGDYDNNGIVDIVDFSLLRYNFGWQGPIQIAGGLEPRNK